MIPAAPPSALAPSLEVMRLALEAAGLRAGDRFELAVKSSSIKGIRSWTGTDPELGLAWLASQPEGDRYLGLNPIKPGATIPRLKRPGDADVLELRCLLVEVDPGDRPSPETRDVQDPSNVAATKRRAAREVAEEIAACLPPEWHVTRVDSGRGQQIWLRHEPIACSGLEAEARAELLRVLAARFSRPGLAHVDVAVANPSRLARLPGTRNSKTGEIARLVKEGSAW